MNFFISYFLRTLTTFSYYRAFPIFHHILFKFWMIRGLHYVAFTNQDIIFKGTIFCFMTDFILGAQIPCAQNRYTAFQISLKYPLTAAIKC